MIVFCSKCQTNWAKLHIGEDDGEEEYEYCPTCRTDAYLEEGNDIVAYIMNPFTGKIVNADTGEEKGVVKEKPRIRVRLEPQVPHRPKWEIWEDREDKALEAYQQTGSKESFLNSFKETKNLK